MNSNSTQRFTGKRCYGTHILAGHLYTHVASGSHVYIYIYIMYGRDRLTDGVMDIDESVVLPRRRACTVIFIILYDLKSF